MSTSIAGNRLFFFGVFFSGERTIDETTRVDREKEKGKGNDTKILLSA